MGAWGDEMQEFEARIEHSTAKAWLVVDNMSANQAWLPKSVGVVLKDADPDGNVLFQAPTRWLKHVKFIS